MDVHTERAQRVPWRMLSPESVDEAAGGDHVRRGEDQHRQNGALAWRTEAGRAPSLGHLEWTQQAELHFDRLVAVPPGT